MKNQIAEQLELTAIKNKMEALLEKVYQGDKEAIEKLNRLKKAMVSN
ncbi:hypothetical protein R6231_10025 [Bacillus cytotoxicus]|uniref:Uncharacterized protein n=1 Tax=Bacillus cytotoxicus TaxID=580165 RepID=A0AAX2CJU4_9BACI|nr:MULTISPECIES: hypothetical protein [Bacillus cereus group]MDH2863629.1 hypothetical protein [Bacillus cytotoxicus]MDH2866788.1 hypothetical protein [Bacillus cytotoxicus]MDH2878941.1 hypothetical protein [Bacillus cytotoxicus]MDH2884415.1 hypothetical protein [Bacillus cytotoxicus]MDH2887427.1 hypothetical protein [Bacillus cytotoxicus]